MIKYQILCVFYIFYFYFQIFVLCIQLIYNIIITKEQMFMHLSYFLITSKSIWSKIEICFITQRIQIYQFNFAYLFDHISIFIKFLVHI